jgi:hypothetical protein
VSATAAMAFIANFMIVSSGDAWVTRGSLTQTARHWIRRESTLTGGIHPLPREFPMTHSFEGGVKTLAGPGLAF